MSRTEPKNIKEAMADSAWIKSMQEERHQFDRLMYRELSDIIPLCKNVITLRVALGKTERDEKNTVIPQQISSFAKGYAQREGIDFRRVHWPQFASGWEASTVDSFAYAAHKSFTAAKANLVQSHPTVPTKHKSDVRYHFIKEQVEKGIVELFFVGTEYQLADLFTKALSEDRFKSLVRQLGMRCLTPDELEVLAIESA
ncbi:hypothetical protein Tco_0619699 [Tanacetum coccineum]